MSEFALIVTGREMRSDAPGKPIMTEEGERFWVTIEREGWVPATSRRCDDKRAVPGDVKTFPTAEAAEAFAKAWSGHPWWCSPRGEFEVVPVKPRYRKVLDGYDVA